jgi:hypothetical protein
MRTFDPVRLGNAEADAWIAYYRREWLRFLRAAVAMVRTGFALSWPRSIHGAWYVLRGNQLWAPFPDNDAAGGQEQMRRFYTLISRIHRQTFDIAEATRLEIRWWRAHRELQHQEAHPDATQGRLVDALARCTRTSTRHPSSRCETPPRGAHMRWRSRTPGWPAGATRAAQRWTTSGRRWYGYTALRAALA